VRECEYEYEGEGVPLISGMYVCEGVREYEGEGV
jgi:hypothetical protein